MQEFDQKYVENVLRMLDGQACLFPQFALRKINNELCLLGTGGFSAVYEMYNKERPENSFALKVIGFKRRTISSTEFRNTSHIQWILSQESRYIMRILDVRELVLSLDEDGNISSVRDATKEVWEETEQTIHLQLILMEKLEELLVKDRFNHVHLLREELDTEPEVIKFALEIGQALAAAHTNHFLHRDIKLENIFWDEREKIYKLGDFGIAKWAEDGNAETIVYTDGYGAPEIERRLYDNYNATADIYSFGITLYLLLNDLRFPASDGYYSRVELQYDPDFTFPAPVHASERMAHLIRKMCSFYPQNRYQTVNEVLAELAGILDYENVDQSEELLELADIATETYSTKKLEEDLEKPVSGREGQRKELRKEQRKTRAERKKEQEEDDALYQKFNWIYFFVLTVILTLLLKGLQPDSSMITNGMFFLVPAAVLLEALFQRLKEFHLVFGTMVLVFSAYSIGTIGLTAPHIILILCVLIGCPVITLSGSVATGLWMLLEYTHSLGFLDYLSKWNLGWILLILLLLAVNRYFLIRMMFDKTTVIRSYIGVFLYNWIMLVVALAGLILFLLQKCNVIAVPDIVGRMHLVRTGVISFAGICFFQWKDGVYDDNEQAESDDSSE